MKLGSILLSLVVLSGVGSVACSSSNDAAAAAAKTEAQEEDEFLSTYCQIVLPCCNKILAKAKDDVAGCKTRLMALDPVTVKTKEARDACLTQSRVAVPDPKFCSDFAQAKTLACPDASRAVLTGTKKINEVCTTSSECAPDFTGIVTCGENGVCQIRKRGALGDMPCDQTIEGDVTTSLPQPADGATAYTCYLSEGLQCDADTKSCINALADHAACTDSSQCDKTQYCDRTEKHCFNRQVVNSICHFDDECEGHCNITEENKAGHCADKVGVDGDCGTPAFCTDGLACVSGKCTQPEADARLAATCGG